MPWSAALRNARPGEDQRHADGVLVEVLLADQAVAAERERRCRRRTRPGCSSPAAESPAGHRGCGRSGRRDARCMRVVVGQFPADRLRRARPRQQRSSRTSSRRCRTDATGRKFGGSGSGSPAIVLMPDRAARARVVRRLERDVAEERLAVRLLAKELDGRVGEHLAGVLLRAVRLRRVSCPSARSCTGTSCGSAIPPRNTLRPS